jgi:hypothetical protein
MEIRPLGPDDDLDAQRDLSERAFGVKAAAERESWKRAAAVHVGQGTFLGAFAAGRPVEIGRASCRERVSVRV